MSIAAFKPTPTNSKIKSLADATEEFYNETAIRQERFCEAQMEAKDLEKLANEFSQRLEANIRGDFLNEVLGAGPLEALLSDASISEILINRFDQIWIERFGKLSEANCSFTSPLSFRNFLSRVQQSAGVEVNLSHPFADGVWRGQRLHLAAPPCVEHPTLSLRKKSKSPWTLESLEAAGWASPQQMEHLRRLFSDRCSFLVVGGTSSGKTSVLNALLGLADHADRWIVLEDTPELILPNSTSTRLTTRKDAQGLFPEVSLQDLVRQSLRMRPDRLAMGEIRGPEAKDLLMAFATGHDGSCGTLHANNGHEALLRLEMLIQLGAPQWSIEAIRRLIHLSLRYLIIVGKNPNGERRLQGLHRLSSCESFGITLEQIF